MDHLTPYIISSVYRLLEARGIAESLRHDQARHRLAMMAVFVLEDSHEVLLRVGGIGGVEQDWQ